MSSNKIDVFAKNSADINYVALGDSITQAGFDANGGFVGRYKNYIATDLGVSVNAINLGVGGATSSDLLNSLKNDHNFRTNIANAHVITIDIGLNDLIQAGVKYLDNSCGGADNQDCLRVEVSTYQANLALIISEIRLVNPSQDLAIIISDNYYPSLGNLANDPNFPIFNPYLKSMNNAVVSVAQTNSIGLAKVNQAFNGISGTEDPYIKGYILPDGLHPTALGFDVIAGEFRNLNSFLLGKDFDNDGFNNSVEKRMATDMLASCPTSTSHNAWPPDTDNTGKVLVSDILLEVQKYYTNSPRYDFDGDGKVTVYDILTVRNYYSRNCPQ